MVLPWDEVLRVVLVELPRVSSILVSDPILPEAMEVAELLELDASKTTPDEIAAIKSQLDLILEMNSTCEGANQVKAQYDELLKAKLLEIERAVVPLLLNLKKNKAKDYIYWPGKQREAQCDLQIQKVLGMTRSGL